MKSRSLKKASKTIDIQEVPASGRQELKQKEKLSEDIKTKYINELEERNRKLKYEIMKINEMLESQKQKTPLKKEYKLIPQESSSEVIKKQLQNVYKQIKNYEHEISQLEAKQAGGMITDKMSKLETILKQKNDHLEKLKNELSALTKTSLDNSKKLKNNAGKQELQNSMLKYNEEIKVLREKVREAENKEKKKAENARKQLNFIKNLESELVKNGVSFEELKEIEKNNIFNQIYDKMSFDKTETQSIKPKAKVQQKEEIQDMTIDRFLELKNEAKLYKKLHIDYDKRLEGLQKDKVEQQRQTNLMKIKLNDKEDEIAKLQQQIGELKKKIKRSNLRPSYSLTKAETSQKPKSKPKMSPTKMGSSNSKSVTDQIHLKFDEKGEVSEKGVRFTDRNVLGRATDVKIIGVKVWTDKSSFAIHGIQCIYKSGDKIKNGIEHINKETKKNCSQNSLQLPEGDYIKSISGHINQNNIIEYLVFISKNTAIGRMGIAKPSQKQFNYDIDQEQIPICMYGSILNGESKSEASVIENLGFEIGKDKGSVAEI